MESWNVAVCKRNDEADFYLLNRSKTAIKFTTKIPFNMGEFLSLLEDVKFPLKMTEGLDLIQFRRMKNYYGMYSDNIVEMGAKPKRHMTMYIETFVHEVAHHLDSEEDYSPNLKDERKKKGKYIGHESATTSDAEYFARGFEKFYSLDKSEKKSLRKRCPKLYRTILKLHKKYSVK